MSASRQKGHPESTPPMKAALRIDQSIVVDGGLTLA
jgi:hypothetical protein